MTAGIPAVALAGQVRVGRREAMTAGLSGAYAVCDRPEDVPSALADPVGTLEARAARVAATWSPASEGQLRVHLDCGVLGNTSRGSEVDGVDQQTSPAHPKDSDG